MRIDVMTLFPDFIAQAAAVGVVGRAQERGLLSLHGWNPRDYASGGYRRVDDRPFGGGPGMVMLLEPLRACLEAVRAADPVPAPVIYMSPQGAPLTQKKARELAALPRMILLCGRYEGVDERFLQAEVDEELSIGDYVLSGGELAAAVVIDAVGRLQEGALNDAESAIQDSFEGDGLLDCPHYTQPSSHPLGDVPAVLRSGDHAAIARWRRQQALGRTWLRRPDLLDEAGLSKADRLLLEAFRAALAGRDGGRVATRPGNPVECATLGRFTSPDPIRISCSAIRRLHQFPLSQDTITHTSIGANMSKLLQEFEASQITRELPAFGPGDTVVVNVKVKEGNRERVQAYEGVVIAKKNAGLNSAFTVRKISHGYGVERVFQTHSASIDSVEVKRRGKVRAGKLYYLRDLEGKAARIKEDLAANAAAKAARQAAAAAAE